MEDFKFESVGPASVATGENWEYRRFGCITEFRQKGKVPSLRVIKKLIKLLEKGNKDD